MASRGQFDEAIFQFQQALKLKPGDADAHGSLAWLRATCPQASLRNGAEAIEHAQQANQLSGGKQPDVLHTLAAAYAEAGRFPEALATVRKALDLATQQNNRALADALRPDRTLRSSKTLSSDVAGFRAVPAETLTHGGRTTVGRPASRR